MKSIIFKISLMMYLISLSQFSFGIDTGIDPEFLKLKVSKLAVSESIYCTNPVTVFEIDEGDQVYEDLLLSPTLGSGSVDNGRYECVIIEFSDYIKFAALENSDMGNCSVAFEYTNEICRGDFPETIQRLDGTQETCSDGEQTVTLYLSTGSINSQGDSQVGSPFTPPVPGNLNNGFTLNGALTISQGTTATFIVNALGRIEDNGQHCEMMAPSFGFSSN